GLSLSGGLSGGGGLAGALSGGVSGALSAAAGVGASFDVDAPTIPASMLRQEIYQEDVAVWQDGLGFDAEPAVALSASLIAGGVTVGAKVVQGGTPANPSFLPPGAVDRRMKMELERTRRKYQQGQGRSDCRRMGAGYRFTLGAHPVAMINGEYTVTSLEVVGIHPDFLAEGQAVYRNRFRCVPSSMAPRPKRPKRRPKPGMEVARVVGFFGNETLPGLEANLAGYVRVRFRWDVVDDDATPRGSLEIGATPTDDVYSVWLPVVQPWAGAGYGAQFIPREGMEVLVGFMEDQSERPVILGCLYSDANQPPWPANVDHQKVGIRSQTRPENGGYSELSIDDRQGGEVVQIRAQKDMREDVLNDRIIAISHDRTTTIGNDSALTVTHDRSVNVTNNQAHTVGGSDTVTVIGDATRDLRANVTLTVKGATSETLFGELHRTLKADVHVATEGRTDLQFTDDYVERHKGHRTVIVGTGAAHRSAALHVEGDARAYAAKKIEVETLEGLSIICGDSQLLMSPKGITLSTPTLTLAGSTIEARGGTVAVASTGDLKLGGATATVQTSGARMALDSSTATLTGSQVKLGGGSGATSQTSDNPATITKVQMKDPQGNPRANARVLLTKGGKDGEERMTVLDENGYLELIGTDSYTISFPDDAKAK
ncbi:MAG: type VI secretion system Vgr family protein, partial [Polyangiaceae bacterium]